MQSIKATSSSQVQCAKEQFLKTPQESFSRLLPGWWFEQLQEQAGDYRDSVFGPLVTLQAFVEQALSKDGSCSRAVAGIISDRVGQGLKANAMNTGPYCKARQRLPLELLEQGSKLSGQVLEQQLPTDWRWNGYRVKIVDGTTMQMADTPANQARFPQSTSQAPGLGFPILRLVGVVSLASGAVLDYAYGRYAGKRSGEMSLFSRCRETFEKDDLLLADSYYCTWAVVALLAQRDVPVLVDYNARMKLDWRRGQRLGFRDQIIEWKKPPGKPVWLSSEAYRALPKTVTIRRFSLKGKTFVTTLLDAERFPKPVLSALYRERWSVELDLRTLKTDLGLAALRCRSPEMVEKELAVTLLAYNFIRATIAQAAYAHQRKPCHISFRATVQLLCAFRPWFADASASLFETLQRAIVSTSVGQRKRPPQPRAVKKRPKQYPRLMVPRRVACQNLISSWT